MKNIRTFKMFEDKTDAFLYCKTCKRDTHHEYSPEKPYSDKRYKCRNCGKYNKD